VFLSQYVFVHVRLSTRLLGLNLLILFKLLFFLCHTLVIVFNIVLLSYYYHWSLDVYLFELPTSHISSSVV